MDDYTYNLNGLLIGKGTKYKVMKIDGLFSLPDVVHSDEQREVMDGERSSHQEVLGGRTITIDLALLGDEETTTDELYADLQAVTSNIRNQFDFIIKRPGFEERKAVVKIRRRAFANDYDFSMGLGQGALQLKALDPRIYTSALSDLTTQVQTSAESGGFEFNMTFNMTFGLGSSSGTVNAYNSGTYSAPAIIYITGPVTNPTIENIEQGRKLSFNAVLLEGETLVIDLVNKSIMLNGTSNRRNWMTYDSKWFLLEPGDNSIRFSGIYVEVVSDIYAEGYADTYGGSSPPTVSVEYRSAWV